jgi:hypothetical protein
MQFDAVISTWLKICLFTAEMRALLLCTACARRQQFARRQVTINGSNLRNCIRPACCAGSSAMTMSVSDMLGADVETQGTRTHYMHTQFRPAYNVQLCRGRTIHMIHKLERQ